MELGTINTDSIELALDNLKHFGAMETKWAKNLPIFDKKQQKGFLRSEVYFNTMSAMVVAGEAHFECTPQTIQMGLALFSIYAREFDESNKNIVELEQMNRQLVLSGLCCLMIASKLDELMCLKPTDL